MEIFGKPQGFIGHTQRFLRISFRFASKKKLRGILSMGFDPFGKICGGEPNQTALTTS